MLKQSKIAILMISVIAIAMVAPASAYLSFQNIETKAERMVDIADGARDRVLAIVDLIEANATAMELITGAGLNGQFYDNVSLCIDGEGWTCLYDANQSLLAGDYEDAVINAKEALTIFRDVLRAINVILVDAGVEIEKPLDAEVIQEAIDRSLNRVEKLKELISPDAPIYETLMDAKGNLTEALEFLPNNVEDAKSSLRKANILLGEISQYLKQVAQELVPSRIRDYCEVAGQYGERFREQFRGGWDEGFDVNGFLQTQGYQNEDDFMGRFQEMIENAKGTEDIEDLEEIGRFIREMDQNLNEEMARYRARHGQSETGSGYGQNAGGYGGSLSSGQPGYGGGQ